jgi:hypothetical protein|tara:strand:+ start:303 stop:521 length:219 start_codon:yes stop_codon:yes gene_type:complete
MERNDTWYKYTWKESPNYLGNAISLGDVDLSENGKKGDNIFIVHRLTKDEHFLGFLLDNGLETLKKSFDDDI